MEEEEDEEEGEERGTKGGERKSRRRRGRREVATAFSNYVRKVLFSKSALLEPNL